MAAVVETFTDSVTELGETYTRTTEEDCSAAIASAIQGQTVGADLPFPGVSLPDEVITHPTPAELQGATTGVTPAGLGIANYGSVVLQSTATGVEPISLYPERHIVVLRAADIVSDMPAAFEWLAEEFDAGRKSAILASGPSATGDMGAIVEGVHGPLDVHIIVVEEP